MRRILGVVVPILAAACLGAGEARANVIECGALLASGQNTSLCVRAIGWQDWQPVVLSPCPTSERPELGILWKVFQIGNSNEHFIRTLLRPDEKRRMEVRGWSHDEGGLIQIWGANWGGGDGNQKWRKLPDPSGAFRLQVVDGEKCLSPNGNEQQLVQKRCDNTDPSQLWSFRTVVTGCPGDQE
jgi:hypothetical protein